MITIPLILPILPLLAWGSAAIAGAFIVKKVFFDEEEIEEVKKEVKNSKKIAILGLQQAGKTTFLRFLQRDKDYKIYRETGIEEYKEFDLRVGDKVITIAKNSDIGGSKTFVRNYRGVLKDADMAFFIFDVSRFFNDTEYFRDFCARVDYLKDSKESKLWFIATHPDQLESEENVKVRISKKLTDKHYKDYVESNLFIINLLNEKQLTEFVNNTFNI